MPWKKTKIILFSTNNSDEQDGIDIGDVVISFELWYKFNIC